MIAHENLARDMEDSYPDPFAFAHGAAGAREAFREIGRTDEARLGVQKFLYVFPTVKDTISSGDHVTAGLEKLFGDRGRNAGAVGGVLGVADHEVHLAAFFHRRDKSFDGLPARFSVGVPDNKDLHFAISSMRVSRITMILIWPGNCSCDSIFLEISRARAGIASSATRSGFTSTRTSRPPWMAKDFSTPGCLSAISS